MSEKSTMALMGRILPVFFCILLFFAITLHQIYPSDDPYRCKALLGNSEQKGTWLHPADEKGARGPFKNWQPDGCMLHHYKAEEIRECMGDRHAVFSGDSTTRQIFWGMARLLDRTAAKKGRDTLNPHTSYNSTIGGVRMIHIWNPYWSTVKYRPISFAKQLELISANLHDPSSEPQQLGQPGLVMLGAGAWYAGNYHANESEVQFEKALDNITEILHLSDLPTFGTVPMDPEEGLGNEVFIAPVAPPFYEQMAARRTGPNGIQKGEVEAIDAYTYSQEKEQNLRLLRAFPQLSLNQPGAIVDKKGTGFHVIDSVAEIKANILLNLRCNAKLDRKVGYPYSRTCCTDYGGRSWMQVIILGIVSLYAIACVFFESFSFVSPLRVNGLDMKVGIFVVALIYCYAADRTHLFSKGMKEFVSNEFYLLMVICSIFGGLTIRKVTFRAPRPPPTAAALEAGSETSPSPAPVKPVVQDAGILARDQTEEWKGWMQAAILVYHWTGASSNLPIYIFIRLLVAAYLFQTGYGHTIYFLSKKDFSFRRVTSVLLRLNILSCVLPYVMGTDYMFYYFAPLVTFWFLVVYATMAVCSGFNDSIKVLGSKILASFIFITVVLNATPLMEWFFVLLGLVFRIKWDLAEWQFRVTLDGAIVFVGMLAGVVHQRVERDAFWYTNYKFAIVPSLAAVLGFGYFCSFMESKSVYITLHPIISIFPILGFIGLRNAVTPLRNRYSTAAAWLGKCSLETFILQFHIFLAGDTKGVLLLDIFKGDGSLLNDRWRDLVVIVPVFLWISHLVAEASGQIVKLFLGESKPKPTFQDLEDDDENQLKIVEPVWETMPMLNSVHLDRAKNFCKSITTGLHMRVGAVLTLMWVLNWLY
ncbi:o-acetyltransferase cas1 [Fusarium longipes]|uniref:O-acetyltransferase cas1 n=1 Tax=Fusarium longipes TaxID=694270 RepID=A0A395T3H9_9HYPO|nr:o-acetyltransferase cas1 [Fusarium longipes]